MDAPSFLDHDRYDKYGYIEWINTQRSMYPEQTKITCSLKAKRNHKAGHQEESDHSRLTKFKPIRNKAGELSAWPVTKKSILIQRVLQQDQASRGSPNCINKSVT